MNLTICISLRPDQMHHRELDDVVAKSHSPSYLTSWQLGEVPSDRRIGNITSVFKKGTVSLTSVLRKIMKQFFVEAMLRHTEEREIIQDYQHSFTKGKLCLAIWWPPTMVT